jgi:predicted small metal-binding protein
MAKMMYCRDAGFDCNAEVHGRDEEQVMEKAAEHVKDVHSVEVISPDLARKVQAAIHDE